MRDKATLVAESGDWVRRMQKSLDQMNVMYACTGRVSEVVGLKWEDFDFEAGTLLVQRSVVHGRVD